MQLSNSVLTKEQLLSKRQMRELTEEQAEIVDLLVLSSSNHMLGMASSMLAFYTSELRLMAGHPPTHTVLLSKKDSSFAHRISRIASCTRKERKHQAPATEL